MSAVEVAIKTLPDPSNNKTPRGHEYLTNSLHYLTRDIFKIAILGIREENKNYLFFLFAYFNTFKDILI